MAFASGLDQTAFSPRREGRLANSLIRAMPRSDRRHAGTGTVGSTETSGWVMKQAVDMSGVRQPLFDCSHHERHASAGVAGNAAGKVEFEEHEMDGRGCQAGEADDLVHFDGR